MYVLADMRRLARGVFSVWWTAAATTAGVLGARLTGDPDFVRRAERVWARRLLRGIGVRWQVDGLPRFPEPPCLVIANHQSYLDVPLLIASLPVVPGFVAKRELQEVPFLGLAIRSGGHVLLDRSDRKSALSALKNAALEIRRGKTIAIFPEGTRGDGRTMGPFKRGGFVIAKRARVPVVPVAIRGSSNALPRDALLPRPACVEIIVGDPVLPAEIAQLSAEALAERVRRAIEALGGAAFDTEARPSGPTKAGLILDLARALDTAVKSP